MRPRPFFAAAVTQPAAEARLRQTQSDLAEVVTEIKADAIRATRQEAGLYAPTQKQVTYYRQLAESPLFTETERRRALEWLETRATRQTIKDQIDWLKGQVETRGSAAPIGGAQ